MIPFATRARFIRVLIVAIISIPPVAALGVPSETARVLTSDEAVRKDAEWYASAFGVTIDEAESRLLVQLEATAVRERIAAQAGERFAGSWIQHTPEFRVVVAVTGEEPLSGATDLLADPSGRGRIEIAYGALHSLQTLRAAMPIVESMAPKGAAVGLRLSENSVVLYTLERLDWDQQQAVRAATEVPLGFELMDGPNIEHSTRGGRKLQPPTCTTGFTVRNGNGVRGVITAAHCWKPGDNDPVYWFSNLIYYSLDVVAEFDDADEDWAYLRQPSGANPLYPVEKMFWDGSVWRTVTEGDAPGQAMMEGDTVCHYGFGSELDGKPYSCGVVTDAYHDPGDFCGEPNGPCNEAFAFVRNPTGGGPQTEPYCAGGDSGGPWFLGFRAYGIHKGGNEFFHNTCYFTRTQKIDNHGFNILEQ